MNYLFRFTVVLLLSAVFCGCQSASSDIGAKISKIDDPTLRKVIEDNTITCYHSIDCMCEINCICGSATATYKGQTGQVLMLQDHEVAFGDNDVEIVGKLPEGHKKWCLNNDKADISINGKKIKTLTDNECFEAHLMLLLERYAFAGVAGVNNDADEINYVGIVTKGGKKHHRIDFTGDFVGSNNKMTLWINTETNQLDKIWLKYNRSGKDQFAGVNIGQYKYVSMGQNGIKLPFLLEFVESDKYQYMNCASKIRLEFANLQVR
ncbi:MAG: hypothetical protein JEZ07_16095 [Phycisphaerae bacterium]|nr:hypothetical protein [Phycisphaerae bacterium]